MQCAITHAEMQQSSTCAFAPALESLRYSTVNAVEPGLGVVGAWWILRWRGGRAQWKHRLLQTPQPNFQRRAGIYLFIWLVLWFLWDAFCEFYFQRKLKIFIATQFHVSPLSIMYYYCFFFPTVHFFSLRWKRAGRCEVETEKSSWIWMPGVNHTPQTAMAVCTMGTFSHHDV